MAKPITLSNQVRSGRRESMISANGGLPAHRYTPQVTPRWPRGSEPASVQGLNVSYWDFRVTLHTPPFALPVRRKIPAVRPPSMWAPYTELCWLPQCSYRRCTRRLFPLVSLYASVTPVSGADSYFSTVAPFIWCLTLAGSTGRRLATRPLRPLLSAFPYPTIRDSATADPGPGPP